METLCADCGRPCFWDESRNDYRHAVDSERGCFLIPAEPDLDALANEFVQWIAENRGNHIGDAEELLLDPTLTAEQRAWVSDFCLRWDAAIAAESAA